MSVNSLCTSDVLKLGLKRIYRIYEYSFEIIEQLLKLNNITFWEGRWEYFSYIFKFVSRYGIPHPPCQI